MAKIHPTSPLLIMLYGFTGAGKTFFARQLSEHVQSAHVQGDRIRYELFKEPRYDKEENEAVTHLMDYMTEQFLSVGISVIYDTNAMRAKQRREMREVARKMKAIPVLIWVQIDQEGAFSRVAGRDRRRIDDKYAMSIDRTTFDNLARNMQNPTHNEDYIVISGKHSFTTQDRTVVKKLRESNLLSIEVPDKVVKPGLVNLVPNPAAGRVDISRRNIIIR